MQEAYQTRLTLARLEDFVQGWQAGTIDLDAYNADMRDQPPADYTDVPF